MSCKINSHHEHHLLPRFEGGEDIPSNLVCISDVCHTMWHWNEWKRTGVPEHLGGYYLLLGQLNGESHSEKMKRLWSDPEVKSWLLSCRQKHIKEWSESGHFSEMGKLGGRAAAKSKAMMKSRYKPDNQRKHCTQNNPDLVPLLDRWLTFKHVNGYSFTAKFDYTLKPIIQKLSLFSGKVCSPSRWTKLFTQGVPIAGWTMTNVSII